MSSKQKHSNSTNTKYSSEITMLKDIFPDWSEMDLMAAIEEAQGDVSLACTRISEGQAEQWNDAKAAKRERKPKKFDGPIRGNIFYITNGNLHCQFKLTTLGLNCLKCSQNWFEAKALLNHQHF
jgi:hypothetical protein